MKRGYLTLPYTQESGLIRKDLRKDSLLTSCIRIADPQEIQLERAFAVKIGISGRN